MIAANTSHKLAVIEDAELLFNATQVERAISTMAQDISAALGTTKPLILPVMVGGLIIAGRLLPQLDFALQVDYVHATRYHGTTKGQTLRWFKKPTASLADKTVLLLDDILDQGITLQQIVDYCYNKGAKKVWVAVLAQKKINRTQSVQADFIGLCVPDRYVFGYGMDYYEYHRNVNGIYAVRESTDKSL